MAHEKYAPDDCIDGRDPNALQSEGGTPPDQNDLKQRAQEFADLGFPVVATGAHGRPIEKNWPDFSPNPEDIDARFRYLRSACGLAVVLRRPWFVVDLDRGHADGVDGIAEFHGLVLRHGSIPSGPRTRTKRGGLHAWFRAPDGVSVRTSIGALGAGIDVKGPGSCVKVPPTAGYVWATDLRNTEPPLAPVWLVDLVAPILTPRQQAPLRAYDGGEHAYARAALERELRAVSSAAPGQRNQALFIAAASLGGLCAVGALPVEPVAAGLIEAAHACGLVDDDGRRAVEATVAGGLKRGRENPRTLPSRREGGRYAQ